MLDRSKLNSIESKISETLMNNQNLRKLSMKKETLEN